MRSIKIIVTALACSFWMGSSSAFAITIDEFLTSPTAVNSVEGDVLDQVKTLTVSSTGAVGGKRQLAVAKTSDDFGDAVLGTGTKIISGVKTPFLAFTLGVSAGRGRVTWDADSSPDSLSPQGLGSINLTEDGADSFETGLVSFDYPSDATLSLRLYDASVKDGSKYSEVTITLNQKYSGPGVFPLSIPFALFTSTDPATIAAPGGATFKTATVFGPFGGVDVTRVGAIELAFAGDEADITIAGLRTNGKCTSFPKADGDITDRCGTCYLDADPSYSYEASKVIDTCGLCPLESDYSAPDGKRDDCGVCLSGEPGYIYQDPKDTCGLCPSAPNFERAKDPCGVCFGNGSSCADCSGVPNGTSQVDRCGVCAGDGTSCLDCLGVPFGTAGLDRCNVCNGDGSSCLDCEGIPFGTKKIDACGDCGGLVIDEQSCPQPITCVTVPATAKVKKFDRGLTRKARTLRTRYMAEKKRAERMACGINTATSEAAVMTAHTQIVARSREIFSKGVEVCGDSCVTVSYAEDVEALLPYFKTIERQAKLLARRVKRCYSRLGVVRSESGTGGLAKTLGTVNRDLRGLIAACRKQKACPPK